MNFKENRKQWFARTDKQLNIQRRNQGNNKRPNSVLNRTLTKYLPKNKKKRHNQVKHLETELLQPEEQFCFTDNLEYLGKESSCDIHNQEREPECEVYLLKSELFAIKTSLEFYDMQVRQKKRNLMLSYHAYMAFASDLKIKEKNMKDFVTIEFERLVEAVIKKKEEMYEKIKEYFIQAQKDVEEIIKRTLKEIEEMDRYKKNCQTSLRKFRYFSISKYSG